ncbi:MAG: Gfo/Idh/MocA family oxidoreductase [Gaiellaceae bacterium MAG52_C11]|nr:Gfo/Idh/MocA family oxidoreductase [Candidatus Gaiellasilicea maunaloa]
MRVLRVGVIGCGSIARAVHLPVLRRIPGVVLAAVADIDPAALEAVRRTAPSAALCRDAAGLLARADLDAVVVTAPSGLHAELALAVAGAGRHLYLEKPLATTHSDGEAVVAAAAKAGIVAAIGFNRRFHPAIRRARSVVRAGGIGRVGHVSATFTDGGELPAWKLARADGGGALLDLASHHVDLVRFLLDAEIEAVEATMTSTRSEHDGAIMQLRLTDGAEAELQVGFRAPQVDVLELTGSRGAVRIDRHTGRVTRRPQRLAPTGALALLRLRLLVRPDSDPSYALALRAFVARVRGDDVELPTLEDGLASLLVVLAAEEAAAS